MEIQQAMDEPDEEDGDLWEAWDDVHGGELPIEDVKDARKEEEEADFLHICFHQKVLVLPRFLNGVWETVNAGGAPMPGMRTIPRNHVGSSGKHLFY